jgi:hypothetical protein
MKPANEDEFYAESMSDWIFTWFVAMGALSAFFIALGVSL